MTTYNNYAFTTNDSMEVARWVEALSNYETYGNMTVDQEAIDHILSVDEHNQLTRETGLEVLKAFFS
jgi:hypothetical protein